MNENETKPAAPESFTWTADDDRCFAEGNHTQLDAKLGAHPLTHEGHIGTDFAVWAPRAREVFVIGGFNGPNQSAHPLERMSGGGSRRGFVPGVRTGTSYKFHIVGADGHRADKADPFAFRRESSGAASLVWELDYRWGDHDWMAARAERARLDRPMSIYEVHLGSWMRVPEENNRCLTYRETAAKLANYTRQMGYTHVEFLPVMEAPFESWGYQTTGFFAASSRYGTPQDLMHLIDALHQHEVGVILDFVPSHFPPVEQGLARFDGAPLYEFGGLREKARPEWNNYAFDYSRGEVRSFLASAACFWLDKFHADGLRFDDVASMLYLDYDRRPEEWKPNPFGGRENLEGINFLRRLNEQIYARFPDIHTIAEESSGWPLISKPASLGGLGFGLRWDMTWLRETLEYFGNEPGQRRDHQYELTQRPVYAFSENFVLPVPHDEVARGQTSLLSRMPGDDWRRFANLRLLHGWMCAQPGKKLVFMGGEFGQWNTWNFETSLDWHLVQAGTLHQKLQRWVSDANWFYQREPALHQTDFNAEGFEWIDASDVENSAVSWLRRSATTNEVILVILNFTPTPRFNYRIGVPRAGFWKELLNSDATEYGGSGQGNFGGVEAAPFGWHLKSHSLMITLPPLGAVFFKHTND